MKLTRLQQIITGMRRQNILVVGDVMLDHFIWGRVARISPEAPVPVVEVTQEDFYPGGAANVARNLRAMGCQCQLLGLRGADQAGEELCTALATRGIDTRGLVIDEERPTTVKTRIVAHQQQVVRFDKERGDRISPAIANRLLRHFAEQLPSVSAVLFEDYAKGTLTQSLVNKMHRLAHRAGKITAADPNARQLLNYRGFTAVTPNRHEAFAAAGVPLQASTPEVLANDALMKVGQILLKKWHPANLLITLGEDGMCLFRTGHKPHHIPTEAREVFDVSGAGDTVIATLTLALAAGANPMEAAQISNHAAGVVVGKVGTATCSPAELVASLSRNSGR